MFFILFDRTDRLGSHIMIYIGQIVFAHKNSYIIKFREGGAESYRYYSSPFIRILFDYIENQNTAFYKKGVEDGDLYDGLYGIMNDYPQIDWFLLFITTFLYSMECDYLTYFHRHISPFFMRNIASLR